MCPPASTFLVNRVEAQMQIRLQEISGKAVAIGHDEQEQARILTDPFTRILRRRQQAYAARSIPDAPGKRAPGVVHRIMLVNPGLAVRPRLAYLEVAVPIGHPERVHVGPDLGKRCYFMVHAFLEVYALGIELGPGKTGRLGKVGKKEIPVHRIRHIDPPDPHHVVTTTAPSLYFIDPSGYFTGSLPKKFPGYSLSTEKVTTQYSILGTIPLIVSLVTAV